MRHQGIGGEEKGRDDPLSPSRVWIPMLAPDRRPAAKWLQTEAGWAMHQASDGQGRCEVIEAALSIMPSA